MESLSERQKAILKKLLISVEPISIEALSKEFNRGIRAMRYDLAEVKNFLSANNVLLQTKPKQGYYIQNNDKAIIYPYIGLRYDELTNSDELTDRVKQLIFYLFVARNPVSTQECADALYLSQSSILRLIKMVPIVTDNEIEISRVKKQGYTLMGDEYRIRNCVKRLCVEAIESYYSAQDYYVLLPKWIQSKLSLHQFKEILATIKKANDDYQVWLSEYAFIHLVVYVVVSKLRMEQGHMMIKIHNHQFIDLDDEYDYAQTIFSRLLIGEINPYELEGLVKQLISEGIFVHSIQDDFGVQLTDVVKDMMIHLKENYPQLAFDYVTLESDLSKHLYLFIKRSKIGVYQQENPLLSKVKEEYPQHFLYAKELYQILMERLEFEYSENEVSFLTIYLYKNQLELEQEKKFRIYVVCASSKGFSELIVTRVKHVFPQIEVTGILSIDQILTMENFHQIDFVLSTIPLKTLKVPVIHITTLFNIKDIEQVQRFISLGESQKAIPEVRKNDISAFIADRYETINNLNISTLVSIDAVSTSVLNLLDVLMDLSPQYNVTHEKMLGVMIHMLLAIPRWLNPPERFDPKAKQELLLVQSNHSLLAEKMNSVFKVLEQSLNVQLTDQEKLSFYDYIIEKD